jgi:EAL domain-containing protein (putative c-di-GMP-specific phosphodiesterase class I)
MAELNKDRAEQYVISHLDEALEKGWIRPFYQPVIRTVTERMMGAEALARWEDPVYGCIMPAVFVPTLEKSGLIYKLDCFIIREVLKLQKTRREAGLPAFFITVNLSRLDFDHVDMVGFVKEQVQRYGVSRNLICLEITESVLIRDKEKMTAIVRELRGAGFQIWMDDFGSGYSSLIFLNDYTLDVIKFDLGFLQSFTRTSMEIIRSTVDMAKNLGIRTLAEGVERKEHVRFLKQIGCDMMQGYYYGRPCSRQGMDNYICSMEGRTETIEWKQFYDLGDACVVNTDVPRAVLEYDSKNFQYLFANERQKEQLRKFGRKTLEESEFVINNQNSPLRRKLKDFIHVEISTRQTDTLYFSDNSNFARLEGRMVARKKNHFLFLVSLVNITEDRISKEGLLLNNSLTDIDLLFDDVHVFDLENNTSSPLITNLGIAAGMKEKDGLREGLDVFCSHYIYPPDRERYRAFADTDTMQERLRHSPDGILCDYFRTYPAGGEGEYEWKEYNLLLIPGTGENQVLSCVKKATAVSSDLPVIVSALMKEIEKRHSREVS